MPPNSISNMKNVIKYLDKEKTTISKCQDNIQTMCECLQKFIKKYPTILTVEKCYDYDDPEDFYEYPLNFYIHKKIKDSDIKLLNSIFVENKLKYGLLCCSLNYNEYGQIITLDVSRYRSNPLEVPHVYTDAYQTLIKCLDDFCEIKSKKRIKNEN